jgi:hypothetical protein
VPAAKRGLCAPGGSLHAELRPENSRIRRQNRNDDGTDGRWWSALYQRNPVPADGAYFTKEMFASAPVPRRTGATCSGVGLRHQREAQNDWTVGICGYLDDNDVSTSWRSAVQSQDTYGIVGEIPDMAKHHPSSIVLGLEDGQIYKTRRRLEA